ncbi:AAA family ATPase [Frigidibacter sp. ROC022]|uniref:AAA family ATPase n=1 Tax=Frigidibacter sp. ROC022 TaxID=2971796 RepID=UPI00215B48B6|nr:AAA family ATPase [Frigidibacter sp. ROC022]MCR8725222.1 AAA family ATPase [Frigidibacter sp. ROC022]
MTRPRHIILSGCSGGGKSTLLAALAARGHATVPEPGRRLVQAALAGQGGVLPWEDGPGFAAACIDLAVADHAAVRDRGGPVFFDRSGLDAVLWLQARGLALPAAAGEVLAQRFERVFLVPPWPELRVEDAERKGSMAEAEAEYHALAAGYPALGHPVTLLPKGTVAKRPAFLAGALDCPL